MSKKLVIKNESKTVVDKASKKKLAGFHALTKNIKRNKVARHIPSKTKINKLFSA